jgi:hypothetical protein
MSTPCTSMSADLCWTRGDSGRLDVSVTDADGDPYSLAGATLFLTVKTALTVADASATIRKEVTAHDDAAGGESHFDLATSRQPDRRHVLLRRAAQNLGRQNLHLVRRTVESVVGRNHPHGPALIMAAYYKVEVSLGTNAVEVGVPSPQSVNVVLPLIGPTGPQGAAGAAGATGAQGPQGVPGTGLEVLTTQGDLLYQGAATGERLPIGTNGQVLKVSGGIPAWGNESGAVSSVAGRTGAVVLAVADVADAVATSDARLSDARTPSSTLAHASTHHTGGTDAIAPNNISAAWALTIASNITLSADETLTAGRNVQQTISTFSATNHNVTLPTSSLQAGDTLTILGTANSTGNIVIRRQNHDGSGFGPQFDTLATVTGASQRFTFRTPTTSSAAWTLLPVDTHTQPASTITGLPTASTATPSALGVASAGSSADFARADHVHGNLSLYSQIAGAILNEAEQARNDLGLGSAAEEDSTTFAPATGIDPTAISGTAVVDSDARLSDARTPTSHTHGNLTNDGKVGSTSGLPLVTTTAGAVTTLALGTAGQVLQVNSGANGVEFAAASGGIGGSTGSTDNARPRPRRRPMSRWSTLTAKPTRPWC